MIERIGKYRLQGRIGRGGMGSVFKAYDPVLERPVALKVVPAGFDADDDMRARFLREARAAAKLTHPNIVTVYDLGEADGYIYIAMELLEGRELRQLIAARAPLDLANKLSLIAELGEGLTHAHQQGIVHRDIKPGNIFILPDGHLKILDFGTARISSATGSLTRRGELVGTLQYMAPERLCDQGDARADIFSVGVVLYELLTYRAPFTASDMLQLLEQLREYDPPPPSRLEPSLPPELDRIVARALEKEPARRFGSLAEMCVALDTVRRRVVGTTERLRAELATRIAEMDELEATAAVRVGGVSNRPALRMSHGMSRHELLAMRADVETRTAHARALLARDEALEPVLERGLLALARGDWNTAVTELERVVGELPDHPRAAPGLAEAQGKRDESRPRDADSAQVLVPDDDAGVAVAQDAVASPAARPSLSLLARALDVVRPVGRYVRVTRAHAASAVAAVLVVGMSIAVVRWPATPHRDEIGTLQAAVAAARERAAGVDAAVLARAVFTEAGANVATAERLVVEAKSAAAAGVYREAIDRYAEAERQARIKSEERAAANAARDAMGAARARASDGAPGFATAEDRARRGDASYGGLDFKGAAAHFAEATTLYTKAVAPVPPPRSVRASPGAGDVHADVRASLQTYVRAIRTKDLPLLRQVRPNLGEDEARRWVRWFEMTRSRQVDLEVHEITVRADEAQVTGRRQDLLVLQDGQRMSTATRFVYTLKRRGDDWVLHDLAETQAAPAGRR